MEKFIFILQYDLVISIKELLKKYLFSKILYFMFRKYFQAIVLFLSINQITQVFNASA